MLSRYLALPLALVQLALACTNSTAPHATITSPATTIAHRLLPSTRPTSTTATFDLSYSAIDKEITSVEIADREFPITCVDCSTSGSLQVFVHNAEANDTSLFKHRKRNLCDLDWPGPSGSLVARFPSGFEGHVELSVSTPATLSHDIKLAEWPLFGIDAPGIGLAGVVASLTIPLELALSGEAEVSSGFNFSLPRNASVAVQFPCVEESTSFGFKDSEGLRMDSLPVTVSTPGLDVTLTTGLRLQLEVGVKTSDSDFVAETGATMDLPKVVVKESQLINVDETCNALSRNLSTAVAPPTFSSANATFSNLTSGLASAVGDYTHIAPSIGVDLDLYAKLNMPGDVLDTSTHWPIFATAWPLPTACFDNGLSASSSPLTSSLTPAPSSTSISAPTPTPIMTCIETVASGTWAPRSITTVTRSAWVA